MESTGVVLKPVWYALEDAVDELVLVNARKVKKVPGCKTDVRLAFAVASSCEVVVSSTCNASRWLVVFPRVDSTDDNFPTVSARCTRVTCSDERAWRNSDRRCRSAMIPKPSRPVPTIALTKRTMRLVRRACVRRGLSYGGRGV